MPARAGSPEFRETTEIQAKKYKIDKLKGPTNYDNSKHQANIKILEIHEPRKSTKYSELDKFWRLKGLSRKQ